MEKLDATLVLIKPDGLKRSLTGNILTRFSETKLEIVGAKMVRVTRELASVHYQHLKDKPFFEDVLRYLMGEFHDRRKVMALVYWGEDAIKKCRTLVGATNPEEADSVSIRGSFGRITTRGVFENVVHVSAVPEDAEREIKLWFDPNEIIVDLWKTQPVIEKKEVKAWL